MLLGKEKVIVFMNRRRKCLYFYKGMKKERKQILMLWKRMKRGKKYITMEEEGRKCLLIIREKIHLEKILDWIAGRNKNEGKIKERN